MDEKSKKFIKSYFVPDYAVLLLELYGFSCLTDLESIDQNIIQDIEHHVRTGLFQSLVDFACKNAREKYLGFNVLDVSCYSIKPMDKKKLLLVGTNARDIAKKMNMTEKAMGSSS